MTQIKIRCLNNNVEGIIYPDINDIDTVILHIHGGGFIAMSSITHLIHTREIAHKTSIPLFSIDYRLAPKYPYPNGFEDWVNAYVWLTTYGLKKMNLNPSKIILIGDSAGGNLISAISVLAIKWGIRVPDMLILLYPALQFSIESVFPSMFYFLTDPALNFSFARFINDSYIQDHKSAKLTTFWVLWRLRTISWPSFRRPRFWSERRTRSETNVTCFWTGWANWTWMHFWLNSSTFHTGLWTLI